MHDKDFYKNLKDKMVNHDMLYNEYVDFPHESPLLQENFNILQNNIIAYINNKDELTMHELSKIVNVLPTNLSPIVKNLEERNWGERFRKEDDKRFVFVRMSDEGKRKIEVHTSNICTHLENTLNAALTQEEQDDMSAIYDKLVIYFQKMVDANKNNKL